MKVELMDDGCVHILCPGCRGNYRLPTRPIPAAMPHPIWKFNGDVNNPTIEPSILCRYGLHDNRQVCHSFVRNGSIEFLPDCTHALAGKTVVLPDIQEA